MTAYTLRDENGDTHAIEAADVADAGKQARSWVLGGSWGEVESTIWVGVTITDSEGDDVERLKVAIDPEVPECEEGEQHDWQAPHALLGGLEENPGVWGHGGGVVIHEVCMRCGCKRVTDTWAQDMSTGEQGLESVKYEPGAFTAAEIEEARE